MARLPPAARVRQARQLTSVEDARKLYRDWARDYDADIAGALQFTGGADVARLLARFVPDVSASVIDIGCGTGLVGAEMRELGYHYYSIGRKDVTP